MSSDNKDTLEALLASRVETHVSAGLATALTTTYPNAGIALTNTVAVDATAKPIPSGAIRLEWLHGRLDTIVTAASITWYLSMASDGGYPVTDAITTTILVEPATIATGGVAARIDLPYRMFYDNASAVVAAATAGTLYLFAKTNAGTCNITPRLVWTGFPPYPRYQYLPTL